MNKELMIIWSYKVVITFSLIFGINMDKTFIRRIFMECVWIKGESEIRDNILAKTRV